MTTNAFEITYGSQAVGGASTRYLLDGPYAIDKGFQELRVAFQVQVVAESFEDLQDACDTLETAFRSRDQNFTISLDGNDWVYTFGDNVLKTMAALSKVAARETDRGFGRAYTCTITAELPADDQDGMRDLSVSVIYEPGRRKQVAMQGVYTALEGTSASAQYAAEFNAEATAILTGIDGSATWELVAEQVDRDRVDHVATFSRQYTELLVDQSLGTLDDTQIRDHRVRFSRVASYPGDTDPNLIRLQRVMAEFDCWADVDVTTDLEALEVKVRQYVLASFVSSFSPTVYAAEDSRVVFDQSSKRLSFSLQIIYQPGGGGEVLESHHTMAYREQKVVDYTPIHSGNETDAYVDVGFVVRERVFTRNMLLLGQVTPRSRTGAPVPTGTSDSPAWNNSTGATTTAVGGWGGPDTPSTGWITINSTSQSAPLWLGDSQIAPQFQVTAVQDVVTQRYNSKPSRGGSGSGFPTFSIPSN